MTTYPRDILQDWDVLVVEDDPVSMDIATRILKAHGARVYTATNGEHALTALEQVTPRFILSDLSMPMMDGWELIDRLRQDSRYSDVPIFALTAHAMIGDREKAIAAGFHNYMTKPFTVETFMQQLLRLLEGIA